MAAGLELDDFKVPSTQSIPGFYLLAPAESIGNKLPTSQHKKATLMFANIQEKERQEQKSCLLILGFTGTSHFHIHIGTEL